MDKNVSNFVVYERDGIIYYLNDDELCFSSFNQDGYINLNEVKKVISSVDKKILEEREDLILIKTFLLNLES